VAKGGGEVEIWRWTLWVGGNNILPKKPKKKWLRAGHVDWLAKEIRGEGRARPNDVLKRPKRKKLGAFTDQIIGA